MRPPFHLRFVDKAAAAVTAAVEVYNKPSFMYREETFAILALNAWELLLKAKVLKESKNDVKVLRIYEPRDLKGGGKSSKLYPKRNGSGNFYSTSLFGCVFLIDKTPARLPPEVIANLQALAELRDNSVHYVTSSAKLARQVQELAAGCISNFVVLLKRWFTRDMSKALSLVLPLSFVTGSTEVESAVTSADETRLIKHLQALADGVGTPDSEFSVAIRVAVKFEKSNLINASKVIFSKDLDAVKVVLSETDIRTKFPWNYYELLKRLAARYRDFSANPHFHEIKKPLLTDERYVKPHYFDPGNTKGAKKNFFNPNVLQVFDLHYTKR